MTTTSLTIGEATLRESALRLSTLRESTLRLSTRRLSALRKLALSAGVALVRWAYRRPATPTHEQQSLRLAAQAAAQRQRESLRYGIAQ